MNIDLRAILITCIAVFSTPICVGAVDSETPSWLKAKLDELQKEKRADVIVSQYIYKDESVYVFDQSHMCCDRGASMYSSNGSIICGFIGFAGLWQESCADFSSNGRLVNVLYGSKK